MKNKRYNLSINSENVDAYSELYNAKCFFSKENFKKLNMFAGVNIAIVLFILAGFPLKIFSEGLFKFFTVALLVTYVSTVILESSYLIKKQIKAVKEKYPFIDSTIPTDVIRDEVEKYICQKSLIDTPQNNNKKDVIKKVTEEVCNNENNVHKKQTFSEEDKLDELYAKMAELEEIIQRKEINEQKSNEDIQVLGLKKKEQK